MISILGEWHDYNTAFDHTIKAIHSSRLTRKELNSLKKIKIDLFRDKEQAFEKVAFAYMKLK
jgi:hypothetical protein